MLFIRSYLKVSDALVQFITKYNVDPSRFFDMQTWVVILLISILMVGIIFGVLVIFIYYQKLIRLYRFQQNFINGFTHELKTPIASLRLYLDTFNKYDLGREDQKKYLNYMIQDTERLALNVNQILNLSKLEDKRSLGDLTHVDLFDFVQDFLDRNPQYFEELDISLEKITGEKYPLKVDKELFEIVLMNILTNSIRYKGHSAPQLKITFEGQGERIKIRFKDAGMGLERNELKNIFKKLYQVGKTTKGSGLGLYITQNIVKMHKGEIVAESEGLGKGVSIVLTFKGAFDHE